jgi:hypothetical protein
MSSDTAQSRVPSHLAGNTFLTSLWRSCPQELESFVELASYVWAAKRLNSSSPPHLAGLRNANFGIGMSATGPMIWVRDQEADRVLPVLQDNWPHLPHRLVQCNNSSSYPSLFPGAIMLFARLPFFFGDIMIVGKNSSTSTITLIGSVNKESGQKQVTPIWTGGSSYQSKELLEEAMRAWYENAVGLWPVIAHEF